MQLFIPPLRTKLRLLEDWTFQLQNEYRNEKFWETIFGEKCPPSLLRPDPIPPEKYSPYVDNEVRRPATLPAGTVLRVDRIYIRNGASDFDSVTFNLAIGAKTTFKTEGRFWVKLADANTMQVEVVG